MVRCRCGGVWGAGEGAGAVAARAGQAGGRRFSAVRGAAGAATLTGRAKLREVLCRVTPTGHLISSRRCRLVAARRRGWWRAAVQVGSAGC